MMMKRIYFLILSLALFSCSSNKGIEIGNPQLPPGTVKASALVGGEVTVTVPIEVFGNEETALRSTFDLVIEEEVLALGMDTTPFFNLDDRSLQIGVQSPKLQVGKKLELFLNKPNRSATVFQIMISDVNAVQAAPFSQGAPNGSALVADAICNRIRDCTSVKDEAFCSLGLISEPSLGNSFLETYGTPQDSGEDISLLKIFNGIRSGTYALTGEKMEACLSYLNARTCDGPEASIAVAYDPAKPDDFSNIENLIEDDGPCGKIVKVF